MYVLGGLLIAWLLLHAIEPPENRSRRGVRLAALLLSGVVVLAMFVLHKLHGLDIWLQTQPWFGTSGIDSVKEVQRVLSVIGYSYMALRWVDLSLAVSEGRHKPPGPLETINYLAPFHMLAMGPIQSFDDFKGTPPSPSAPGVVDSFKALDRIASGLFKKYVLAAIVDGLFLTKFRSRTPYFLIELQMNYVWMYLDFSAYSDIAVGLGMLIGRPAPENFNRPFIARNMIDYWERWHISLSQFIRRNVFIPIQMTMLRSTGGASPLACASIAFLCSFLLCGVWHEISWRWFAWGLWHATGLVVCNLYRAFLLKKLGRKGVNAYMANPWFKAAATFITFEYVALSLVIVMADFKEFHAW